VRTISLRRFRDRAAEIREPVEISLRDPDGNLRIIGFFTPYGAPSVAAVELSVQHEEVKPHVIKTPKEAAAAAKPTSRAFPKSAQLRRR